MFCVSIECKRSAVEYCGFVAFNILYSVVCWKVAFSETVKSAVFGSGVVRFVGGEVYIFVIRIEEHRSEIVTGRIRYSVVEGVPCETFVVGEIQSGLLHSYEEVVAISKHRSDVIVVGSFWARQFAPYVIFIKGEDERNFGAFIRDRTSGT